MALSLLPCDAALLGPDFPLPLDEPFTVAQASAAGITRSRLARLTRDGFVRRMLKGVYVAAQAPDHVDLRLRALTLVAPPGVVATDWTAVWIYTGLLPFGGHRELPPVSLFRLPGRGRLRNGLSHSGERDLRPRDVQVLGRIALTTPLRTAWDVGRLSRRDDAIGGLDALLRLGDFDREELVGGLGRFRGARGVVQLRALAPLAEARSESPGESVLRLRWLDLTSLPQPDTQISIPGPHGRTVYRLDLGIEELRFAVEYDGEEHHTDVSDREHDRARRTWIRDELGWIIEPVRRSNVFGPTRDIEAILIDGVRRARRRAGTRPAG